ncbi:MAG TPA: hypothetical protein VFW35_04900, partial [Sphingomicrobium sp.]|nr:hypothetical protein [Sphingomicrobium sp.]
RLGSGGTQKWKNGTLYKRLGNHALNPLYLTGNWTQYHRRWVPVWAAVIPETTQTAVELCEKLLFGQFAQQFTWIDESGGSGFYVPPRDGPVVLQVARRSQRLIRRVLAAQSRDVIRPAWERGILLEAYLSRSQHSSSVVTRD